MSRSEDADTLTDDSVGRGPFDRVLPGVIRRSLLAKVFTGLIIIALFNILIGGFFYVGISDNLDEQINQQAASTITLQTNVYDTWFQDRRQEVETVARDIPLAEGNEAISEALEEASTGNDDINAYHYVDAETGRIIASSNENAIGSSLLECGFDPSLFTERQFVKPGQYETVEGKRAIALGQRAPFLIEDYVVAEYSVETAGPRFEQPIEGTKTSLVTGEGATLLGPSVDTNSSIESQNDVSIQVTDEQIISTKRLESNPNIGVVTQTPKTNAYRLRNAVLRSFAITILLTFVMLVGVTIVGGRATMRDLNALADRAMAMGDGDLDVDLTTARDDELGVLFQAFDTMRNQLKDRIADAEQSRERAQEALEAAKAAKKRAERAQDQAEEFNNQLQVVDRILRHNLHNALNVIILDLQTIQREGSGETVTAAENIEERIDQLLDEIEKQRRITRTLSVDATLIPIDLVTLIESVLKTIETQYPEAEIELSSPESALVLAVGNIEHAFQELVENAIEHNDHPRPNVEITIAREESTVTVTVADDGPGIPAVEREVLLGNREIDSLHHGSGTGLWLIFWLVKRSEGRLEFEDRDPRGSAVSVELERGDPE